MTTPPIFRSRSLWYESAPSVLTTVRKCSSAQPRVDLIFMPMRRSAAPGAPHETTKEEIGQVHAAQLRVGLYAEPRWFVAPSTENVWKDLYGRPIVDPLVFRRAVSKELLDLYAIGDPVMFDFEKIPSAWLKAFLVGDPASATAGWRGLRGQKTGGSNPWRESAWTDASFQIGNYSDEVIALLRDFGFAYFDQLYYGGMEPVEEREDAIKEIQYRGFSGLDVFPFYDAAHAPGGFREGCMFTSNRWPYLHT